MRSDIEYELYVRQPVEHSLSELEKAATAFGVKPEELDRAAFNWVMKRLKAAGSEPEWLRSDLKIIEEG